MISVYIPVNTTTDRELGMDLRDHHGAEIVKLGTGGGEMMHLRLSTDQFKALLRQARNASALV